MLTGEGSTAGEIILSPVTRVGRAADNELRLTSLGVSQFHATIAWVAPGIWELRDLGSSNGTFIGADPSSLPTVRVLPGDRRKLAVGSVIAFGDPTRAYRMTDASRPRPEAWNVLTGERHVGSPSLLTLSEEGAFLDVLEDPSGGWVIERNGQLVDVRHGDLVTLDKQTFRVGVPVPVAETEELVASQPAEEPLASSHLTFFVSSDLETVGLEVTTAAKSWSCLRAYTRALLELAKVRLADRAARSGKPHDEGWIYGDELCTLADYDGVGRLNVEIHRARADFARRGVPGAASIVERRRGTGQLRIGTHRLRIVHGAHPVGALD